ncbi:MAG: hypothetical protein ACXVP2_13325 [Tumebacillaceae bacterium]
MRVAFFQDPDQDHRADQKHKNPQQIKKDLDMTEHRSILSPLRVVSVTGQSNDTEKAKGVQPLANLQNSVVRRRHFTALLSPG